MTVDDRSKMHADGALRAVPVAWAALEDAFENNAPEVHSYLHLVTGDVIRVVDGVADPVTHSRIVSDGAYRRVDPVSSREQYRWMERFIATVEDIAVRQRLLQSIDGKGAFRRFKDALMTFSAERERWFVFRSERLKMCMEAWLEGQGLVTVPRPEWPVPGEARVAEGADVEGHVPGPAHALEASDAPLQAVIATTTVVATAVSPVTHAASAPTVVSVRKSVPSASPTRVERTPEGARTHLLQLASALPQAELETAVAFLEFLLSRRAVAPVSAASHAAVPEAKAAVPSVNGGSAVGGSIAAPAHTATAHKDAEPQRRVVPAREVDISARRPSSADSDVSRRPVVLEPESARKSAVDVDAKDIDPTRRSSGRV